MVDWTARDSSRRSATSFAASALRSGSRIAAGSLWRGWRRRGRRRRRRQGCGLLRRRGQVSDLAGALLHRELSRGAPRPDLDGVDDPQGVAELRLLQRLGDVALHRLEALLHVLGVAGLEPLDLAA